MMSTFGFSDIFQDFLTFLSSNTLIEKLSVIKIIMSSSQNMLSNTTAQSLCVDYSTRALIMFKKVLVLIKPIKGSTVLPLLNTHINVEKFKSFLAFFFFLIILYRILQDIQVLCCISGTRWHHTPLRPTWLQRKDVPVLCTAPLIRKMGYFL